MTVAPIETPAPEQLRFGRFVLSTHTRQLVREGQPVTLGGRAFAVLAALLEHHERVVTQAELLGAAWQGRVVQENNLQVQVNALRRALGNGAIETVHGVGYRFALPVEHVVAERRLLPGSGATSVAAVPHQGAAFIGREDDLRTCSSLLNGTRLLTLTGVGGAGKTRLGLQLAACQREATYPGGVRVADLASLADSSLLVAQVAAAFERRGGAQGKASLASVAECIADRPALLVLDNCEHLLDPCRDLVESLLRECSSLRVLATSRERLGLSGEQLYPVAPLALPSKPGLQPALAAEAVRLFAAAAQRSQPGFAVTSANVRAVVAICRRLDGLPLALELAAAQVGVLSVAEIDERLGRDLGLLVNANRSLPHQQTMNATLEWGLRGLTAEELQLFDTLSVFRGGWTLGAAAHVSQLDDDRTLDALRRLHDKSLLQCHSDDGGGSSRYSMLESVRQFGRGRLDTSGEGIVVLDRHLHFFLKHAETGRAGPRGEWMARVREEGYNLVAAQEWSLRGDDAVPALRLVCALWWYWIDTAQVETGYRFARAALLLGEPSRHLALRARALAIAALYAHDLGDFTYAVAAAAQGLALADSSDDADLQCLALHASGICLRELGRTDDAVLMFARARGLAEQHDLPGAYGQALDNLAETLRVQGRYAEAAEAYAQVLAEARRRGIPSITAGTLCNLAYTWIALGELAAVPPLLAEGLQIALDADAAVSMPYLLEGCAGLATHLGDRDNAARFAGAAQGLMQASSLTFSGGDAAFRASYLPGLERSMGATAFAAMIEQGEVLESEAAGAAALTWLGEAGLVTQ